MVDNRKFCVISALLFLVAGCSSTKIADTASSGAQQNSSVAQSQGQPPKATTKVLGQQNHKKMQMTFDAPEGLLLGDELTTSDAVHRYDIICLERVEKHKVLMRVLSLQETDDYKGKKLRSRQG